MTPPILCCTDFSANATQATDAAAALALRLGTQLLLANSLDERGGLPMRNRAQLRNALEPQLLTEIARLKALGVDVEDRLIGGLPNDGLLPLVKRCKARFVVLGASGTGALGRRMLGSVAEKIAESAPVPTFVLRNAQPLTDWARGTQPLRILVGVDFTANSEPALRWIAELQAIGPCEITLGFVDEGHEGTPEEALRARAREILGDTPVSVIVRAGAEPIDAQLLQLTAETRSDLIVVGTHQWHGAQRLWHSSVVRKLLHDAPISVACVPETKRDAD